ncbi:MAG TPA: hypothetical protein VFV50_09780 [Bdellovibrionales bacterium]|nr:hypothetical protein [Bdellovibrionales bacterium]
MGFGLMTKFQIASFSILHAISALLLPLLIFLLGGCLEPELVNKPGPAIACQEVQTALNESVKGPWTFQAGEFVHVQDTAAPVNQPPNVIRDLTQLVLQVTPQSGYSVLRIEQTIVRNGVQDTTEGLEGAPGEFRLCAEDPADENGTYHNLKVDTIKMPVPKPSSKACDPRYPDCQLNATRFKFDKIIKTEDGESVPLHIVIVTSNEVPYLSRILQLCVTEPLETNGSKIPLTQCSTVQNFEFKAN